MSLALLPAPSELTNLIDQAAHAVQTKTNGRIIELRIRMDEGCLVVSGRTSSYYIKQLVTQAIRETVDEVNLHNDVQVS